MKYIFGIFLFILLCNLLGIVFSDDDSKSSDSSDIDEVRTPPDYLVYKVRGLNTALYYILQALREDLQDEPDEVDTSFFKRIDAVVTKIKYFQGEVDQTNALMLGEILRTLPIHLKTNLLELRYNFNEYTAITSPETTEKTTVFTTVTPFKTTNITKEYTATTSSDTAMTRSMTTDES